LTKVKTPFVRSFVLRCSVVVVVVGAFVRSFVLRCRRRRRCLGLRSFFVVVVVWAFVVVVYIFVVVAAFFGVLHLCVVSVATTCTVVASLLVRTFVFSLVRSLVYLHCRT